MRYITLEDITIATAKGELRLPISTTLEMSYEQAVKFGQRIKPADSSSTTDWRPDPKAWLTYTGELRTIGVFPGEWPDGGLTPEIIKLTHENLPLQAKLLRQCVGRYSGPQWKSLVEDWEERAAIMQFDGGMSRAQAEQEAARLCGLEAFLSELCQRNRPV